MPKGLKHYSNEADCKRYRNHQRKQNYQQTQNFPRRPWKDPWEDELILKHDIPDRELSGIIERSVQSIQLRRSRLKAKLKDA